MNTSIEFLDRKSLLTFFITSIFIMFSLLFVSHAQAASIDDVDNNSLRIGNDIYSLESSNLTDDNIANSIANGGNKVFYKYNGRWFDVYAASSDAFWDNPSNALSTAEVAAWSSELDNWYKAGNETDKFQATSEIRVTTIAPISSTLVDVVFNNSITQGELNEMTFSFSPSLTVTNVTFKQGMNNQVVTLSTEQQQEGTMYSLQINGENVSNASFEGLSANAPTAPSITISNLLNMYDPATMEYSLNGAEWQSTPTLTDIELSENDILLIRMKDPVSGATTVIIPETPQAPDLSNGLRSLDRNVEYEYSTNQQNWQSYSHNNSPSTLAGQTIYLRVKAQPPVPAGEISAPFTVPENVMTYIENNYLNATVEIGEPVFGHDVHIINIEVADDRVRYLKVKNTNLTSNNYQGFGRWFLMTTTLVGDANVTIKGYETIADRENDQPITVLEGAIPAH